MAIVRSEGTLRLTVDLTSATSSGPATYAAPYLQAYETLYRLQPAVRTVVDFIARNIAQLGIHVFRRLSDTDRIRLADHQLAQILDRPNPSTTRYRLLETLMQDLGIYFNAYWLKLRAAPQQLLLIRLPPSQVTVEGGLLPRQYWWTPAGGSPLAFPPEDLVVFGGYDPCDPLRGLSPLETLRRTLAEETAAAEYRHQFWLNSARVEAVITRPSTAPKWTPDQRGQFTESWRTSYGGPVNAGKTPILEDGMDIKTLSHSARDSEYLGARKLAREEVAAEYHVPLPMVGILDHATFSNIKEQHKQLYQDALGPWLEMVIEEIERQLLPECADVEDVYAEFNLADKLKGSFEEQATALTVLTGRPVMTVNEARARLNLPSHPAGDELAIQPGTGAAPRGDDLVPANPRSPATSTAVADDEEARRVIEDFWSRQAQRITKDPAAHRGAAFDSTRWNAELTADLIRIGHPDPFRLAVTINAETRALLDAGRPAFEPTRLQALRAA